MSDLIDREQAIDAMGCLTDSTCEQQAIDALWELPSAEKTGKWIPCTERLPKLGEEVWVTVNDVTYIATLNKRKTTFGDYIQEWWTEDDWIFQFEEIIAWQPLYRPQPYEGAINGNKD